MLGVVFRSMREIRRAVIGIAEVIALRAIAMFSPYEVPKMGVTFFCNLESTFYAREFQSASYILRLSLLI